MKKSTARQAKLAASRQGPFGPLSPLAAGHGPRTGVPAITSAVLRSPGQPLEAATRAALESRFGHDFSRVRVHTDRQAARSAGQAAARAYTCGNEIVFAAGQFAPQTADGRRLLAHELAHVVQQGASPGRTSPERIAPADGPLEAEAGQAAERLSAGQAVAIAGRSPAALQRSQGWSSDAIEINLQPVDPQTQGQLDYTENGFLSQRMSSRLPVYRGPFCQSVSLPFDCIVEFRTDYLNDPRPQPFSPLQAGVDFEYHVTRGGAKTQKFKKSFSDKAAAYTGLNQPLKTSFGSRFKMSLDDNGDFHMVFRLFDPDTGITRLYDDTLRVEADRPCM